MTAQKDFDATQLRMIRAACRHKEGTVHSSVVLQLFNEIDELRAALEAALKPGGEIVQLGSEWTPCVKLPIMVHVRNQREGEKHISTREGITPVEPDDLIMRGVAGEEYPIGRELFQRTYRIGAAPQAQTQHMEEQPDGSIIPVDPSEMAAPPAHALIAITCKPQRLLWAQAAACLKDYAHDQRMRGNTSIAHGAEECAHEIKQMLNAPPAQTPVDPVWSE
jgi:hypothetical protein